MPTDAENAMIDAIVETSGYTRAQVLSRLSDPEVQAHVTAMASPLVVALLLEGRPAQDALLVAYRRTGLVLGARANPDNR